jgi:hypothetical protein
MKRDLNRLLDAVYTVVDRGSVSPDMRAQLEIKLEETLSQIARQYTTRIAVLDQCLKNAKAVSTSSTNTPVKVDRRKGTNHYAYFSGACCGKDDKPRNIIDSLGLCFKWTLQYNTKTGSKINNEKISERLKELPNINNYFTTKLGEVMEFVKQNLPELEPMQRSSVIYNHFLDAENRQRYIDFYTSEMSSTSAPHTPIKELPPLRKLKKVESKVLELESSDSEH